MRPFHVLFGVGLTLALIVFVFSNNNVADQPQRQEAANVQLPSITDSTAAKIPWIIEETSEEDGGIPRKNRRPLKRLFPRLFKNRAVDIEYSSN